MEVEDLSLALQYYWTKDQAGPPTGRDRVQLAAILLLIACTGSRPKAILSIKYSDITIYKYKGHDRLLMEIELTELKNKPEEE